MIFCVYIDQNQPDRLHLRPATLLKKRLCHRCFPVNFAKFLKTPISPIY